MEDPKISVITVVYNDAVNLENTIKSIISQSFENFEFIIVDGGSTDETLEIIEKYREYIKCVVSEPDSGVYDAMNKGILLSKGTWINFLNAGDLYKDGSLLELVASQLKENSYNLLYVDFVINGQRFSPKLSLFYLIRNMICHQALFYRRDLFNASLFDTRLKLAADYAHLLYSWNRLNIHSIGETYIEYLGGGLSAEPLKRQELYKERCIAISQGAISPAFKEIMHFYNWIRVKMTAL